MRGIMGYDQINPAYYQRAGIEAIDVVEAFELGFCLGNAIHYILRAGKKTPDPREDLRKARWMIERELQRLEASK